MFYKTKMAVITIILHYNSKFQTFLSVRQIPTVKLSTRKLQRKKAKKM